MTREDLIDLVAELGVQRDALKREIEGAHHDITSLMDSLNGEVNESMRLRGQAEAEVARWQNAASDADRENDRLRDALQKIAAYSPGNFRPLADECAIWKLATDALARSASSAEGKQT